LQDEKIERNAKTFLLIILFANFIRFVQISIIDIGLPNFVLSIAGTLVAYGIVVGIFSLMQSLFQFPIATLSDKKLGRKNMIIICVIIYTVGTVLCYMAQNIVQLIIFRAIQGMGAYSSIIQAMLADQYRKENEYGKGMALYSLSITIGFFAGFILGGLFSYFFGVRSIFLVAAILALISLIIIALFLKDPLKSFSIQDNNNNINRELKETIKFSELKVILKEKQFRFIIIINMFRWFLFFGIYPYIIWVIQIYYELNQIEATYTLILVVLLYAIFIVLGGFLADHIGHKKTMIIGQVVIISVGFLFFIGSGLIFFLIVSISCSIGFALMETGGNAYLSRVLEEKHPHLKGSGFGFNNALGYFFSAIGPIFICSLGDIDVFLPYYVVSIIIIFSLFITIKFLREIS
jgi:MFS family permease